VEARRWTLYVCPVGHVYAGKDADDAPSTCQGPGMLAGWCRCRLEAIEVMAVSEHERLREAAQAAVAVVRPGWYPAIDRLRTALSSASSPPSPRPSPDSPPAPHASPGQAAPVPSPPKPPLT
jgi:cell division protein FtsN